jgi:putative aldouronate transport system permease protein
MPKRAKIIDSRPVRLEKIKLFALAFPMVCIVFIFCYLPLFGWSFAFVNYRLGFPLFQQTFAGLRYFVMMFSAGGDFLKILRNTLALSLLMIVVMPVPIIFAIMLSQLKNATFSRLVQTISAFPYFISYILIYGLFFVFFSSEDGLVNRLMMSLGIIKEPTNLLGNSALAWIVQTLVYLFKNMGYTAIIYIAAIAGIDRELYEAAETDGAGQFQKIIYITLPGIAATFFVMLLLNIANLMSGGGFEQYYVFQNPLVMDKLEVFDTYVYKTGLTQNQVSYATAVGIFKSMVSILLLFSANMMAKKVMKRPII